MSRRSSFPKMHRPFLVMPAAYDLDGRRNWCRLRDVCVVARRLAKIQKLNFRITPEELVRRFAALIRPNRPLTVAVNPNDPLSARKPARPEKKIFRYSRDGYGCWGTEVLPRQPGGSWTSSFQLSVGVPYPATMFVPQEWAADVFDAIRKGAESAVDFGTDHVVGDRGDSEGSKLFITLRKPSSS